MFFCLQLLKIWVCLIAFPQKRNFMSEMMVSTNILLINNKYCVESYKKQQKTAKNSKKPQKTAKSSKKQQKNKKKHVFLP